MSSVNNSTSLKASRFLALGKSNSKYTATSLGKSLPTSFLDGASVARTVSQMTLSALAPESSPLSASGSALDLYATGLLPRSFQSSMLRPKNHPPTQPTELSLKDQESSINVVTHRLQRQRVPAQSFTVSFPALTSYAIELVSP